MRLTTLKMPQLGESVTEGTVDRWLKREGELVHRDEPIVEVVTDRVNAEIPSPVEGRLVRIKVAPGETVPIGAALAELEVEGASLDAKEKLAPEAEAATQPRPEPRPEPTGAGRLSPGIRKLIEENGLDISQIKGTGQDGRVRREDVMSYMAEHRALAPSPATTRMPSDRGDEVVRISAVRRQIAEDMLRSVSTSPHAWALREVDVTRLLEYRQAGDVRDGTFTLNNTGALGSVAGQSIINQPQAAILSTESIRRRPVVVGDTIGIRPIMNLTMSFDHRIVDGLAASRFLNDVQAGIEDWTPDKISL